MSYVMNVAILGAGSIARTMSKTIRGMKANGRPVELYAVASRSLEKAQAFAEKEGVCKAYGSYEAMLADPDVHLVYIATPHSHHAEQMKMCIEAGKPVLCEKAFTSNAAEAREVLALAEKKGVYVAEALWPRYMPSRKIIDDLIAEGAIGEPRMLTTSLCYSLEHVERMYNPALAGGALLDLGIYVLNFASMVFGDDIAETTSMVDMFDTGVDRTETIGIKYRNGKLAQLMASAAFNSDRHCVVYGTKGYITVDNVNNPGWIEVVEGQNYGKPVRPIDGPQQITGYEYEVEACLRDLQTDALEPVEMPHAQTIELMRQMDALRAEWGMKFPYEKELPSGN